MNRKTLAASAAAMALLVLTGCAGKTPGTPRDDAAPDPGIAAGGEASEGRTVSPLPSGIDMAQLEDCTLAVSFEDGDAFVDDTGVMQLRMTVYDYDTYDMVDIGMLQAGDRIVISQEEVAVTALERSEDGTVILNGGLEQGGYELISGDGGVFYADGFNDAKQYYPLGEAIVPVSADFEFEDSSDSEAGPRTYYPGDFLTEYAGIAYHFVPTNTTVTIQGGYVVHMQRVYTP